MKLSRNGIELTRVIQSDIELIRSWRNNEDVRKYMEYRGQISLAAQIEWFNAINNESNLYFLIRVENRPVGLIYGADINWQQNIVGNAGIFIGDINDRDNEFALTASLLLNDFAFAIGIEIINIKILEDNPKAIAYNNLMGYSPAPGQNGIYNKQYQLNRNSYLSSRTQLSKYVNLSNKPVLHMAQSGQPLYPTIVSRLNTILFPGIILATEF